MARRGRSIGDASDNAADHASQHTTRDASGNTTFDPAFNITSGGDLVDRCGLILRRLDAWLQLK